MRNVFRYVEMNCTNLNLLRQTLSNLIKEHSRGVIASESEAIQALLPQQKETDVNALIFRSSY